MKLATKRFNKTLLIFLLSFLLVATSLMPAFAATNIVNTSIPVDSAATNDVDTSAPGDSDTTNDVDTSAPGDSDTTNDVDTSAPGDSDTTNDVNTSAPGDKTEIQAVPAVYVIATVLTSAKPVIQRILASPATRKAGDFLKFSYKNFRKNLITLKGKPWYKVRSSSFITKNIRT